MLIWKKAAAWALLSYALKKYFTKLFFEKWNWDLHFFFSETATGLSSPCKRRYKSCNLGLFAVIITVIILLQWCCGCCYLALVLLVLEIHILMFELPETESELSACCFHVMCPSRYFCFPFVFMLSSKNQPHSLLVFHGILAHLSAMLMCSWSDAAPHWHHTKLTTLLESSCFWLHKQGWVL